MGSKRPSPPSTQDGASSAKLSRQLTKEESAVYDRQLRVWGVEAQQRMMTSRVLIVGVGGLCCEVAKNLVLAGVGHITLMDHAGVTARDIASNYFLPEESLGLFGAANSQGSSVATPLPGPPVLTHVLTQDREYAVENIASLVARLPTLVRVPHWLTGSYHITPGANRAEASKDRAAELNPFVTVAASTADATHQGTEFYSGFDVVIVSQRSYADQVSINTKCRAAKTLFLNADVHGTCGCIFADLLDEYKYTAEPLAQKNAEENSPPVEYAASFVSLHDA